LEKEDLLECPEENVAITARLQALFADKLHRQITQRATFEEISTATE